MEYTSEGKLLLKNVTLVAVTSVKIDANMSAMEYSMKGIEFGAVKFLTGVEGVMPKNDKIQVIHTPLLKNIGYPKDWSEFMIYKLRDFIDTEFALFIHHDGFVVHPESWTDEFLQYDYIGAPWPDKMFVDDFGEIIRVGNGGFSLRSKKLLDAFVELKIEWMAYRAHYHDDGWISMGRLQEMRKHGIKIPGPELAYKFSTEIRCDELDNTHKPFGFHNSLREKNVSYPKF